MFALFKEMPPFSRHRERYLSDDAYREFQRSLMDNPVAGAVVQGTGGLRKVRYQDARRGKGARGGIRVIYYWYADGLQFWLFAIFDKDEMSDLAADEKKLLKRMLEDELRARQ